MSGKAGLIAAGIVATVALGTGGYFANEWRVCSDMEEGYLDTVYSIRSGARMDARLAMLGAEAPSAELQQARELQLSILPRQLEAIYDRCGADAGKAAARKSEDILWSAP